jgi:hypothetical protein
MQEHMHEQQKQNLGQAHAKQQQCCWNGAAAWLLGQVPTLNWGRQQ